MSHVFVVLYPPKGLDISVNIFFFPFWYCFFMFLYLFLRVLDFWFNYRGVRWGFGSTKQMYIVDLTTKCTCIGTLR